MRTDDSSEIAHKIKRCAAACVIAGSLLPGMPTAAAEAAFYKCVSADGSTTYNDNPCAADESAYQLNKNAREVARLDCRIAHNFAFDAVARMRQGDAVREVVQAYGKTDNLSEGARNLINYVYSFKNKTVASAQHIVELTTQRCEAGLLGKMLDQCEAFPSDFIERFGGCVAARQTDQTILLQPPSDEEASNSSDANSGSGVARFSKTAPTLNAATPVTRSAPDTDGDHVLRASKRWPHPE